jgi:hypothetical protein
MDGRLSALIFWRCEIWAASLSELLFQDDSLRIEGNSVQQDVCKRVCPESLNNRRACRNGIYGPEFQLIVTLDTQTRRVVARGKQGLLLETS